MRQLLIVATLFALIGIPMAHADSLSMNISDTSPYQGDTVVVTFTGGARPESISFDGKQFSFFTYRRNPMAVIPILATQKAGTYPIVVTFIDGTTFVRSLKVRARKFVVVNLGIPKELGLTTEGLTTKLAEQKVSIDSTVKEKTDKVYFEKAFGLPLANNKIISSTFGEIRKTGGSIIHHWGIDIKAREGAAVGAMSGGVVKSVYFDTVYGNVIIIDHGEGIFSLYMHLKKQNVKEGDIVERGTVIGTVGTTGYSTAPHLHLSLKVNSMSVDPIRFVMGFK
ncbi:MAG: M23 family metallopeptidase [Candidatus Paceibacterota bacterium]|jgi:murein DD-endopeptidase MepM/ murein hydrolase activator NlpD